MKKFYAVGTVIILLLGVGVFYLRSHQRDEGLHYERAETELVISPAPDATLTLLKAANDLQDAVMMPPLTDDRIWLPRGNYFLKVEQSANTFFYPIPIVAYRGGPDKDGAFGITIRPPLADAPHGLPSQSKGLQVHSGKPFSVRRPPARAGATLCLARRVLHEFI